MKANRMHFLQVKYQPHLDEIRQQRKSQSSRPVSSCKIGKSVLDLMWKRGPHIYGGGSSPRRLWAVTVLLQLTIRSAATASLHLRCPRYTEWKWAEISNYARHKESFWFQILVLKYVPIRSVTYYFDDSDLPVFREGSYYCLANNLQMNESHSIV